MDDDYSLKINALTEEYKKSLTKQNLSKLKEFDLDKYSAVRCVVVSTDVQHYASSSVSGGGGGGLAYNGTGFSRNSKISSTTEHHVKNEAWVISLENNAEFKIELPADFDVREGHTIVVFGYFATDSEDSLVVERYYNLATDQFALEAEGLFNRLTINYTRKLPLIGYLLLVIPYFGMLYSLLNLRCAYPKLPILFKKYYRVFYSNVGNLLVILGVLVFMAFVILSEEKLAGILRAAGVSRAYLTWGIIGVFIFVPIIIKRRRKKRVAKYINLHSDYINSVFPLYAENIKTSTDTLSCAQEVFNNVNNSNNQHGADIVQPTDTKECPECAEIIKLNARKCRFCGISLET